MVFTEASPRSWQLFRIQLLMKRLQLHSEITQVFLVAPNLLFRTFFNFPGVIFNRRRMLDYDTFDSFTTDQMYCCFVQYIFKTSDGTDNEEFSLVCDCQEGVQGRMCLHKIAIYFKKGKMVIILIRTIYKL